MKIFKTAVLAALMVSAIGVAAHAGTMDVSGEVTAVNSLAFSAATPALGNMNAFTAAQALGNMTISNNDPDGFSLSVSSAKGSKLVRYDGSAYLQTVAGDEVGYTLTFTPGAGTLGATDPGTFASTPLTMTSTPVAHNFTTSVLSATVAKVYAVTMLINAGSVPSHLFNTAAGSQVYRDVVTVTIANI